MDCMRSFALAITTVFAVGVCVAPRSAHGKPKVAVTPIKGDNDDKVAKAVVDALPDGVGSIPPKDVGKIMDKLGLDELDGAEAERLKIKLGATHVVQGKLSKANGKKSLKVAVIGKNQKKSSFTVSFKSTKSETFKEDLRDGLAKRLGVERTSESAEDESPRKRKKRATIEDDTDEPKKKKETLADSDDDSGKKKRATIEDDSDSPKKKKKKSSSDDDEGSGKKKKKKRVAESDDDDSASSRKRKRHADDEDDDTSVRQEGNVYAVAAVRLDAGVGGGLRRLTYNASGAMQPPRVGTTAPNAHIEAELYPFLLVGDGKGALANVGLLAEYDKTVLLSIHVPNTTVNAPIDQAHYAFGAQYRLAFGDKSVAFGARFEKRHYIADRSGLMTANALDMPDVNYTAFAPLVAANAAVTPTLALFGRVEGMLILDTGQIQQSDSYGPASVYGFGVQAGVDYALAKQIALRLCGDFSQISLSFKGTGAMAMARGVQGASDMSVGVLATLMLVR
jgi:hypothetical protein